MRIVRSERIFSGELLSNLIWIWYLYYLKDAITTLCNSMPSLPLLFSRTKLTKIRGGPFLTHALRCSVALSWRIFRRLLKFVGWIFLILVRFVLVSVHQKWKIWVLIIGSSLFYARCLKVFLVAVKSRAVDRSTIQFLTIFGWY